MPTKNPPSAGTVATGPIPGSRRMYAQCEALGLRVPFREILLH